MPGSSAHRIITFALAAAVAPAVAFGAGAQAQPSGPPPPDGYNATINQGNVPTTAAAYGQDCNNGEFANKAADQDGWLFVASPSNFQKLQAQFNEGTITFNGTNSSTAYYTKVGDHVAVITPAGWTLTQAFAHLDGSRNFFTLSHTCAASSPQQPPQQSTPPSATTGDHSCDSVTFNLAAGSQDTTFKVTPTNGSTTDVPVSANQTKPYTMALDSSHPGGAVTANGSAVASYTRPDSCNQSPPPGGGGGDTGGSTPPGGGGGDTGGSTAPGGGGNTDGSTPDGGGKSGVTTPPGSGSTTGGTTSGAAVSGVTGSIRGHGSTVHGTTSVLGEKLTNTSTSATGGSASVEASNAELGAIPFTGFAASHAVEVAALLMLFGVGLVAAGRRRAPAHHYIQVRN